MKLNMFNTLDNIIRTIIFLLFNIIIQIKCNSELNIKLIDDDKDLHIKQLFKDEKDVNIKLINKDKEFNVKLIKDKDNNMMNMFFYKHYPDADSSKDSVSSTMATLRHQKHYQHIMNSQHVHSSHKNNLKILYQTGSSESDLPLCTPNAVCSKLDLYQEPWLERQCRCPGKPCSNSLSASDGHTVSDKTRHFKICEPVRKLPKCRLFRDVTWTLISSEDSSSTEQILHCRCPRGAIAYLVSRQVFRRTEDSLALAFSFACSPASTLKCQRKEPCRLFSVKKRPHAIEEVNTNSLCQCGPHRYCPSHHHESVGVVAGKVYDEESVRTYSGYCLPRKSTGDEVEASYEEKN
uniref:Protein giant-lens n=2 Tax=Cacopsylla melanoneura TaxID=428564 RepID=A0A8D8QZ25_9HEMI